MKETFMECIEIRGVNKYFGETHVLKDVSLSVPQGAVYGLLGPSGCGKTTTVKIMAGILRATSGDVHILGEKMPDLELMKKVGYMAQVAALYQELSAAENLSFFASLYGIEKKEKKPEQAEYKKKTTYQKKSQPLKTRFHNFEQRTDNYSSEDIEDVVKRKREAYKDKQVKGEA